MHLQLLTRLNLVLLSVLGCAYVLAGMFFFFQADRQYRAELQDASERQMQMASAVRKFTNENVRSALLKDSAEFHPALVPNFAANQIMRNLQNIYPGQVYQEVALNPTNPANRAKGWEVQAIQQFRASNDQTASALTTDARGATLLQYARPIKVKDESCLQCHDTAARAPSSMVAKYGAEQGFGWKLGEVVGAQVVSIPAELPVKRRNQAVLNYLAASLVVVVSGFAALNWTLRKAVMRPMQSAEGAWRKLASEDALTGAANRRSLLAMSDMMVSGASDASPMSVIFVDVDHFKRINDGPGHGAGDEVLRELVRRISNVIRRNDVLGRYGGEEFAVLLPATGEAHALALANKLRLALCEAPFAVTDQNGQALSLDITASFGAAQWQAGEGSADVLARADKALYAAKHQGRNRAVAASELMQETLRT